jgi:hypothetical protein
MVTSLWCLDFTDGRLRGRDGRVVHRGDTASVKRATLSLVGSSRDAS